MNGSIPTHWRTCRGINPTGQGLKPKVQSTSAIYLSKLCENLVEKKGLRHLLTDRIPSKYQVSTAIKVSITLSSGAQQSLRKTYYKKKTDLGLECWRSLIGHCNSTPRSTSIIMPWWSLSTDENELNDKLRGHQVQHAHKSWQQLLTSNLVTHQPFCFKILNNS